jgi:hypothetical protein
MEEGRKEGRIKGEGRKEGERKEGEWKGGQYVEEGR